MLFLEMWTTLEEKEDEKEEEEEDDEQVSKLMVASDQVEPESRLSFR